jgi:hypothetical protein
VPALRPGLRAGARALVAGDRRAQHDLPLAAEHRVAQREPLLDADVLPARGAASPSLAAAETAEELRENVLEVREDVAVEAAAGHPFEAGVTQLIVTAAFVFVREDLVRLGRLLEARLRRGVPGVAIRVVLQRGLAIGLADVVRRRVLR